MKKFLLAAIVLLGSFSIANAERFSIGATVKGGLFEVDGASEIFSGNHSGNRSSTEVTKKAGDEGDEAEGVFALGSIFIELNLNDRIGVGANYVPHGMDSEATENKQNIGNLPADPGSGEKRNTVKISFEDLTTVYAIAKLNDDIYAKVGYVEVDVKTKENLATGGAYGDTNLDGYEIALGYNMDLPNEAFLRFEFSYMDLDGATLTNQNDVNKKVKADGITGIGGGISIGKSF